MSFRLLANRAVVTALLALAPRPGTALDLYVDAATGSDSTGDGSRAAPFRSLTRAVSVPVTTWTDVWIGPGTYDRANGEIFPVRPPAAVSFHGSRAAPSVVRTDGDDAIAYPTLATGCGLVEDLVFVGAPPADPPRGTGLWGFKCELAVQRCAFSSFERAIYLSVAESGPTFGAASLWLSQSAFFDNATAIRAYAYVERSVGVLQVYVDSSLFVRNGTGLEMNDACVNCFRDDLSARVINNTFTGGSGDAILTYVTGPPDRVELEVRNNVFAAHGGIAVDALSSGVTLGANDFWMNLGGNWTSQVVADPDNILADPRFVDPAADFHLRAGSPCIDAGREPPPGPDYDGIPRPIDGDGDQVARTDIGAYEVDDGTLRLRRADFTSIAPPVPWKVGAFPFDGRNPRTPVVDSPFVSGDADPSTPPILLDRSRPLVFYQVEPAPAQELLAVKDVAAATVRFTLR